MQKWVRQNKLTALLISSCYSQIGSQFKPKLYPQILHKISKTSLWTEPNKRKKNKEIEKKRCSIFLQSLFPLGRLGNTGRKTRSSRNQDKEKNRRKDVTFWSLELRDLFLLTHYLLLSFFLSLITSWSTFSEVRSWQNDLSLCFIFNVNAYKSASVDQFSIQVIVRPWMLVSQNSLTRLNFQSDFSLRLPTHPQDKLKFTWLQGGSEVEVDFKSLQSRNCRDCGYKRLSVSRAVKCLYLWRRRHDSGGEVF